MLNCIFFIKVHFKQSFIFILLKYCDLYINMNVDIYYVDI
jgi:hypothetical protein